MAITARSHGFFDNAIVGWSHAARSDVTYKKERCENCFCDFHFDLPPFVVLENQFEQREWQHGLITKNVRDKGDLGMNRRPFTSACINESCLNI
jgi:hypothetical protein